MTDWPLDLVQWIRYHPEHFLAKAVDIASLYSEPGDALAAVVGDMEWVRSARFFDPELPITDFDKASERVFRGWVVLRLNGGYD